MNPTTGTTPSTGTMAEGLKERVTDTLDRLGSTAHDAKDRVSAIASSAVERWDSTSRELLETKDEYVDAAKSYVKEHPFTAIGIALAAGFLISRLTRW